MPHSQNPGLPLTRRRNPFDGQGCYAPNSSKIPLKAWVGAAIVVFYLHRPVRQTGRSRWTELNFTNCTNRRTS